MTKIETLLHELSQGRLSRRAFLENTAALGLTAAIPSAILAQGAQAAKPKKGGHFRVATGQGSTTDSLDPAKLTSGMTSFAFYTYNAQLTEVAPDGTLQPYLAESFEPDGSADRWVFNLRPGATFHNGKAVTSDDVIHSIRRHKGEDSVSGMKAFAETIASFEKDGSNRVIFNLSGANADFPYVLSDRTMSILPAKGDDVDVDSMVGAGTYKMTAFEPGVRIAFERNPNHFMNDGRGHVDTAEILTIADSTARINALLSGALDASGDIEAKTADRLAAKDGVTVEDVTAAQHYTFPMRTTVAPFNDNNVRMALKLAIDREAVLKSILRGRGSLGNDHPIGPSYRYYNPDLPQRHYDPEKAKWHLKQAGIDSLDVELVASDGLYPGATDTTVLFSEHAKKAGINLMPKRAPDDGYWSDVWMKVPWAASYWSGRPTEDWMFTQGYGAESSWNESYWQNDRFNELLVAARAELDDSKRRQMYYEMQALCRDEGGSVVHLFANHITAFRDNVRHGDKVAGNFEFDGYKMIERWWLA